MSPELPPELPRELPPELAAELAAELAMELAMELSPEPPTELCAEPAVVLLIAAALDIEELCELREPLDDAALCEPAAAELCPPAEVPDGSVQHGPTVTVPS